MSGTGKLLTTCVFSFGISGCVRNPQNTDDLSHLHYAFPFGVPSYGDPYTMNNLRYHDCVVFTGHSN